MRHMHVFTIQFHCNTVVLLKQGVPPYIVFANKIVATLKRWPLGGEGKENYKFVAVMPNNISIRPHLQTLRELSYCMAELDGKCPGMKPQIIHQRTLFESEWFWSHKGTPAGISLYMCT